MYDGDFYLVIKKKKIPSLNLLAFSTFLCFFKIIFTSASNSGTLRKGKK